MGKWHEASERLPETSTIGFSHPCMVVTIDGMIEVDIYSNSDGWLRHKVWKWKAVVRPEMEGLLGDDLIDDPRLASILRALEEKEETEEVRIKKWVIRQLMETGRIEV